jgi:hypothetical protein
MVSSLGVDSRQMADISVRISRKTAAFLPYTNWKCPYCNLRTLEYVSLDELLDIAVAHW